MTQHSPESSFEATLARLRADRESMPWPELHALAKMVAAELRQGQDQASALPLLHLLSEDPKWEVRLEVAGALVFLPDDDFASLATRLSNDPNAFVRRAAETSLTRRRRVLREDRKKRSSANLVGDLYQQVRLQYGEEAAGKALKMAERRFDELAGAIVHDLRSILTPLKASAGRLGEPCAPSVGIQKAAQRVAADVAFLERYMEDLSAYSRCLPVERTQERLADVVRSASTMAQENLKQDRCDPTVVALDIKVPDDAMSQIARELIVLALANILANAYESVIAKFAPGSLDGRIDVSAQAQADEVRVVVRDNGLGLSADDLEQLRAFAPGRKNKAKRHSTGFGLPIAERYVRAHGGRLDLDGRENEGATVSFTLPLVQGTEDSP